MPPRLTFLINCFDNSTLFVKCSAVRIRGIHLAHTRFIFKSFPKIWCTVVLEIPHLSATSRTLLITSRTSFFTTSDSLKYGLPSRSSSANCLFRPQTFCATWISMNGLLYYVSLAVLRTCAYLLEFFRCPRKTLSPPAAPPFPQTPLFFSNADPVFSASNPDFSAISKLWLFKFSRCNVKSIVNVIV